MGVRVANILSEVFNPIIVWFLVLLLNIFRVTSDMADSLKLTSLLSLITIVPLGIYILWLWRRGHIDTLFIRMREKRTRVYAAALVLNSLSFIIMLLCHSPPMLLALSLAIVIITAAYMLINLRWKISMHTALIGAFVFTLCLVYGIGAIISVALLPAVGWARIKLGYHSPAQVIAGPMGVAAVMVIIFSIFGLF